MMTKEESTKIINFIISGAGDLVLGHGADKFRINNNDQGGVCQDSNFITIGGMSYDRAWQYESLQ